MFGENALPQPRYSTQCNKLKTEMQMIAFHANFPEIQVIELHGWPPPNVLITDILAHVYPADETIRPGEGEVSRYDPSLSHGGFL